MQMWHIGTQKNKSSVKYKRVNTTKWRLQRV